jgi:hypothetical protein
VSIDATTGFRRWADAGFLSELLPIIPPGAALAPGSSVRPEHRGKTPGTRKTDGTWIGLGGSWPDEKQTSIADCKRYIHDGASVGLQTRRFTALDIDVDDEPLAAAIEELARDVLGFAPVRYRVGSPRRLMLYRAPKDQIIRKRRKIKKTEAGLKAAVERLGYGQQCVVEGGHPKGGEYLWRGWHPCDEGPDGLTEVDEATWGRLFQ